MKRDIKLDASWLKELKDEFSKEYMQNLKEFLTKEIKAGKTILPKPSLWFNALNSTPLHKVKVVILGQDPYPTIGHAHGLCFSVMPEVSHLPKSLVNIYKELKDDLGIDNFHTGYLEPWAKEGVLLLNAVLTVEANHSNAHQNMGWEIFTDKVIETINNTLSGVVFILWGANAQKKGAKIDSSKHFIIKSPHPSPLSAYRGFFGSRPFSKTNNFLISKNIEPINWQL
jgi:uracil-DNA glycosylase